MSRWIDLSVPLHSGMISWPGDPPVRIERVQDAEKGDEASVSRLDMGSHTGTHVDSPAHFIGGGATIDRMPLEVAIGRARVLDIRDSRAVTAEELESHEIRRGERVLFKTRNSQRRWSSEPFAPDYVHVSPAAARHLAAARVSLVGIDYLSVGPFEGGAEVHRILLSAGIWILEGLDLSAAGPGPCELVCLPLRIETGDGAPARALLRTLRR